MAARIRRRRRWIAWALAAAALLALALAIEDPRREFTSNVARIAEDAADPALRPVIFDRPAGELIEATRQAARRIKNWEFIGTARIDGTTTIVFERTSRVWKLKDDVIVRVEDLGERCRLTAESRSRASFGDLGRNPRNLRRILAELAVVLRHDEPPGRPAASERQTPAD